LTGTWEKAEALLPRLKERAAKCEELRRLPDETLRDFHDARLFRIHQPKRVGGEELEFACVVTFGALLARACASSAWNWVNFTAHHHMLGMFPPQAQDAIWGRSPDALIASSFVFPAGKARKVKGGYVLSGRWPFSSGVDPSEWNMLAGLARLDDNLPPEQRIFLVPRAEYKVIDTWFAGGLRGTGSKDVDVAEVFVPEHMTLAVADTKGGPTPGSAVNPGLRFQLPVFALFPYMLSGVALGIAEGLIESYQPAAGKMTGARVAEIQSTQIRLGELLHRTVFGAEMRRLGRNALPVFAAGCVLSALGEVTMALAAVKTSASPQVVGMVFTLFGIIALLGLARHLEWKKQGIAAFRSGRAGQLDLVSGSSGSLSQQP
jgi:3-hydroxy-9,10-secoandrosta-1,3,5(10)-triene-9,17-dione monooxygenase